MNNAKDIQEVLKNSKDSYKQTNEQLQDFYDFIRTNDEKTEGLQKKKYEQLLASIEGQEYFRSEHIDNLGLPYETSIILTAKNAGKTWEQYRKMEKCLESGQKFIYMRVMKSELKISRTQFEVDDRCPCLIVESLGRFFLYSKNKYEGICEVEEELGKSKPRPSKSLFDRYKVDSVGYAVEFMNCNSIGGETFKDFSCIIFDECLTHNPKSLITLDHCKIFDKFLSSVVRSKDSLRVFMYGNLTHKNNCLLEHYGIQKTDNFKYVLRDKETGTHLLYANLGGAYGGSFKNQAGITKTGSIESILENTTNKILNAYPRIIEVPDNADGLNDDINWLFRSSNSSDIIVLESRYFFLEDKPFSKNINYLIRLKKVTPLLLNVVYKNKRLYTSDAALSQFEGCSYQPDLLKRFNRLFKLYRWKKLYFSSSEAVEFMNMLYNKNTNKIQSYPISFKG